MTTMIERVARAIAMRNEGWTKNAKDYITHARAAIDAMREPTGAMVAAGIKREVGWEYGKRGCPDDGPHVSSHATYTAMIDAALLEQQP